MGTKSYTLQLRDGDMGIILSALMNQQILYEKAAKNADLKAIAHGLGQMVGTEITIQSIIHRHGELIEMFTEQAST
jgi:hypothetical protein